MRSSGEGTGSGKGACAVVSVWRDVLVVVVEGGKFGRRATKSVASTSTKETLLASGRVRKDCTGTKEVCNGSGPRAY